MTHAAVASVAVSPDLRHRLGRAGESIALAHLERLGYRLLARNFRTRDGELDLVVTDDVMLVFVEVKTRRGHGEAPGPWASLHARKRSRVRRMASQYLREVRERPTTRGIRFDAIGVIIDARGRLVRLDHLEAAF